MEKRENREIILQQNSGKVALYIDKDGNKIEWDHGKIPNVFKFDIDAPVGSTWPPGEDHFNPIIGLLLIWTLDLSDPQVQFRESIFRKSYCEQTSK